MQQFIYHSGSIEDRKTAILEAYPQHHLIHLSAQDTSITIKAIRQLISTLSISYTHQRLVWIEEAQTMTLPAQQALLKTLEEPPQQTIIILSTQTPQSLLPTIRSRCELIQVTPSTKTDLNLKNLALIKQALSVKAGARIQLAHTLGKKKTEAIQYLTNTLQTLYQVMQNTTNPNSLILLSRISQLTHLALIRIKQNTNITLTLESFFLSLPYTH